MEQVDAILHQLLQQEFHEQVMAKVREMTHGAG